jgi:hypothetical protein
MNELDIALIAEDHCPKCLGELDTGWECNECGFDAIEFVELANLMKIPERTETSRSGSLAT